MPAAASPHLAGVARRIARELDLEVAEAGLEIARELHRKALRRRVAQHGAVAQRRAQGRYPEQVFERQPGLPAEQVEQRDLDRRPGGRMRVDPGTAALHLLP
jgi:hypothetical protein